MRAVQWLKYQYPNGLLVRNLNDNLDIEVSPLGGAQDSGAGYKEGVIEAMKACTRVKTFSLPSVSGAVIPDRVRPLSANDFMESRGNYRTLSQATITGNALLAAVV